ncbi:hypothetical protein [Parageobacillus genomosp. 1]|uniref:hypothetical protein n=1 Tax=Parageobacillus genomosp. 1 TaxID=1295642 RepID=UPI000AF9DE7A|nr:hypothetical protein [Parageobacillus genomosp. 1]
MSADAELVINELLSQITSLSRECAIYAALVTQYRQELEQVRSELESLKQTNDQSSAE